MDKMRAMLIRDEGLRLQVYDDATGKALKKGDKIKGHPTIGIGRELSRNGITKAEAEELLNGDLERCLGDARMYEWFDELNAPRRAVVVSMIFQMGAAGFGQFERTHKALEAQDYEQASVEMLNSLWANQTAARAERLAEQMATGEWV